MANAIKLDTSIVPAIVSVSLQDVVAALAAYHRAVATSSSKGPDAPPVLEKVERDGARVRTKGEAGGGSQDKICTSCGPIRPLLLRWGA